MLCAIVPYLKWPTDKRTIVGIAPTKELSCTPDSKLIDSTAPISGECQLFTEDFLLLECH